MKRYSFLLPNRIYRLSSQAYHPISQIHTSKVMSFTFPSTPPKNKSIFFSTGSLFYSPLGHSMPEVQYLPVNLWLLELAQKLHHQGVLKPSPAKVEVGEKTCGLLIHSWWVLMMEVCLLHSTEGLMDFGWWFLKNKHLSHVSYLNIYFLPRIMEHISASTKCMKTH